MQTAGLRPTTAIGRRVLVLASALLTGLALSPPSAIAQETSVGEQLYIDSCAVCHGIEGRSDGPMSMSFEPRPSILTQVSKKNGGVFPFQKVFEIIDGRAEVRAHGSRDMPVWGRAFREPRLFPGGNPYGPSSELVVKGRILALTQYLQSIQD